ncbi:MAG: peptidoglycan endopeptidase [Sphingopyxis terrae]|uniref:peptidoglycan endopeptidase n=1 Tax=Sphingopyxis terrae TaxID=33052 RepID=UPI003F80A754
MDELGARAFAAARAMVGARFVPQGRDPRTGVDCVGLVWAAYAAAGRMLIAPAAYPLRGWSGARVAAGLTAAGFGETADTARVGDVALIALPARQFHLALIGPVGIVHAHAGLRRVVEAPFDPEVRSARRWRLSDLEK